MAWPLLGPRACRSLESSRSRSASSSDTRAAPGAPIARHASQSPAATRLADQISYARRSPPDRYATAEAMSSCGSTAWTVPPCAATPSAATASPAARSRPARAGPASMPRIAASAAAASDPHAATCSARSAPARGSAGSASTRLVRLTFVGRRRWLVASEIWTWWPATGHWLPSTTRDRVVVAWPGS